MDEHTQVIFDLLAESVKSIRDGICGRRGPFALFNETGTKPPLFWCFNNWAEPAFLSRRLNPDQPLIAMRSLHKIIQGKQNKRANVLDVAREYAGLMQHWLDDRPIVVGGNCQAAPIAEAIVHELLSSVQKKSLLITLEHVPFYSYPGDVLMLFGAQSEKFNPFARGEDPVPGWTALHSRPAWGFINAGHGKYFVEPGVDELAGYIENAMETYWNVGQIETGELNVSPK